MKRKKPTRRKKGTHTSILRLLKNDEMPPGQSLKNRGLDGVCLKDLYIPSMPEDHEFPTPWNCMSEKDKTKTLETLKKLPQAMENRIIRPSRLESFPVPKENLFLGPEHVVKERPDAHAPLPDTVPVSVYEFLTDEQRGILMGMNAHVSLKRFLRRVQKEWWIDATMPKLRKSMNESVGLEMHLFDRLSDDCFVVSFRIDPTQRFYVGMAFKPEGGDRPGYKVNLLGSQGPYRVYYFTCRCQ